MSQPKFVQYGNVVLVEAPNAGFLGKATDALCAAPQVGNVGFTDNWKSRSLSFQVLNASNAKDTSIVANGAQVYLKSTNASALCTGKYSDYYLGLVDYTVTLTAAPHAWTIETQKQNSPLLQYGEAFALYDKTQANSRKLCKSRSAPYAVSGSPNAQLQCADIQTAFVQLRDASGNIPTVATCSSCYAGAPDAPTSACVCANPAQKGSFLPPTAEILNGARVCTCKHSISLTPGQSVTPSPAGWLGLSYLDWGIISATILLVLGLLAIFA